MRNNTLIRIFFSPINVAIAIITVIGAFLSKSIWVILLGLFIYILFTVGKRQSLILNHANISIKELNKECDSLAQNSMNSTISEKRYRIRKVIKDKNEILDILNKDKERLIKQKIARQALELVMAYIRLFENYYIRKNDFDKAKLEDIKSRIEQNEIKLRSDIDLSSREQIEGILELDKKVIERNSNEKSELETINAKLTYIETSISFLKQQMLSSVEGDEVMVDVQNVINEVTALDNAILSTKKERRRI